jgi:hypothetical protein
MEPKTSFDPSRLDQISLTQALKDFETANARVLDLTQRLVESERAVRELTDECERHKIKIAHLESLAPSKLAQRFMQKEERVRARIAQAKALAGRLLRRGSHG